MNELGVPIVLVCEIFCIWRVWRLDLSLDGHSLTVSQRKAVKRAQLRWVAIGLGTVVLAGVLAIFFPLP
jgi:hypothetical protein